MYIPRLLVLSLLMSICVAAAAQNLSDNEPGSFFSEPPDTLLPLIAQVNLHLSQIKRPIDIDRLYLSHPKPEGQRGEHDWTFKPWPQSRARVLTQNDVTCLSIRSYRVTRDDPTSDTTRLVGYSTCQPSTKFQVKEANERQEIVPR
jgi:hypothetical protein